MKARLQTSLGQSLVMTPQLHQAIRLLQLSGAELEQELAEAVETNPLLEWADSVAGETPAEGNDAAAEHGNEDLPSDVSPGDADWNSGRSGSFDDDDGDSAAERVAEADTLVDHLLWQLQLSHLGTRDLAIGIALIDALDEDGYLREPFPAIAGALRPDIIADEDEILTVLRHIQ